MPKPPRQKVTDKTPIPWGQHKGIPMEEVPPDYLLWLLRQDWIPQWPDLHAYLIENQDALMLEDAEMDRSENREGGFDSMDEYLRFGRD
jgi:hypothetical protein